MSCSIGPQRAVATGLPVGARAFGAAIAGMPGMQQVPQRGSLQPVPLSQVVHAAGNRLALPCGAAPAMRPVGTPTSPGAVPAMRPVGTPTSPGASPVMFPRGGSVVTTPSQTPRSGYVASTVGSFGEVKSAMASPISSINWQAHCGSRRGSNISAAVSTMTTTPVSQIAEADLPTVPEKPPPRMKVGRPFDLPRASVRAKSPSWSDTPVPKVWHARPAKQREGRGEVGNESQEKVAAGNGKATKEQKDRKSSPAPKGRARSDSPLLSRARPGLTGGMKRGSSNKMSKSTSSLLSSAGGGRQTPLTRVVEEKDDAEEQEGGLAFLLNRMEDSVQSLLRRREPGSNSGSLSGGSMTLAPKTRCSDVGPGSERSLAGQLNQRLEHVQQRSTSQEPLDESRASTPCPPALSASPSRWHSGILVEAQKL